MNYLFLSPHPDDAELACGATIARLSKEGHNVVIAVFSDCSIDMDEMYQAHKILKASTIVKAYPRREFDKCRQAILDDLIWLRDELSPNVVFIPDQSDIHQDHQVIGMEGLRAFKMSADIYSYAHSHNQLESTHNCFISVTHDQVTAKINALDSYLSQRERFYFKLESVVAVMRYYGAQCGVEYAEAFRIIRQLK